MSLKTANCILILSIIFLITFQCEICAQNNKLTFSQVYEFSEPEILQRLPAMKGWIDNLHYLQVKSVDTINYIIKVNAVNSDESIFVNYTKINEYLPEEFDASQAIEVSNDYTGFLFNKDNDLFHYSVISDELKKLTETVTIENNPSLSPDGKKVAFTREHNLFTVDIETGIETQLTFDGSDEIYNGWASWVYWEEILGRGTNNKAYWWAPNSDMISFLWFDDSPVPKFPLFFSDGVHGSVEWEHYPKAGDPNPNVKLGIAHLKDNCIVWVQENENVDQYTAWPFWTMDCNELFYQVLNREQDTLRILSANPSTGKNRLIYTEVQKSWVDFFEDIYIFNNGNGFILRSDKDGWRHLYYYNMDGKLINRITAGNWNVEKINFVDEQNSDVYFNGSVHNSLETHLCKVSLDGNEFMQLTKSAGVHNTTISPDGSFFYDISSNANQPAFIELFDGEGNQIRKIADRKTEFYNDYNLGEAEFFTIPTSDGLNLPAMWILPKDFDQNKKYPVILAIYGGPGYEDVKNSYYHFLDRYFIAQSGIIYFQVDHRGSSHFGKKGTSLMHRNLGKIEILDYIEAVKWLKEQPFIDETKIGIEGASYGGYMALLGLTYGADYFTHGYAEVPGTDWKLYDNIYTERYMDRPDDNIEGYEFGSVMTHAENLKGKLRIVAGTVDDNVHFQQTLQLVEALQTFNKDFELMIYPDEGHGWWMPKWSHSQRNRLNFWFKNFFGKEFAGD